MPPRMEVGLGPADIVLDWDPVPLQKKLGTAPIFAPCPLWPNGWMHKNNTWYGDRLRPRRHCVRWGPSSPLKGAQPPPLFGPYIVAKQSPISASAELLLIVEEDFLKSHL